MRFILGVYLLLASIIGMTTILKLLDLPIYTIISICIGTLLYSIYAGLWYKELSNMEQAYQKNIMHEERIPVIGTKPINWDEYRDIPTLDINKPLIFDRNKIGYIYEPNKPLT